MSKPTDLAYFTMDYKCNTLTPTASFSSRYCVAEKHGETASMTKVFPL